MSDLASNVTWQEILRETQAGDMPHCRAIASPLKWHEEIYTSLAKIILGEFNTSNPDLFIAGTLDKAPNIDECRELINDMALKPLGKTQRRFGIINRADKLMLPAANSLLKLAEEPPKYACLLFLMEDGRLFLPTLRSRSRFSVLVSEEKSESYGMPEKISEWIDWLATKKKGSTKPEEITQDLEAWANFAVNNGDFVKAERVYKVKLIAEKKNLNVPMLCDMILLTLREENINIDDIFNDFW
ncbi:MAG: hypothetical protein IJU48_00395 [Synergistaceae bacterium]|nr:hypothetical protein [Synergistaceae bacterium]